MDFIKNSGPVEYRSDYSWEVRDNSVSYARDYLAHMIVKLKSGKAESPEQKEELEDYEFYLSQIAKKGRLEDPHLELDFAQKWYIMKTGKKA